MKKAYIAAALALILVLAGSLVLYGQAQHHGGWGPGFGGPGMMHRHMLGRLASELHLTDAQKAQIKTMWDAEKPAALPLVQQLANGHKQMLALTAGGKFDEAKVRALTSQQSAVLAQLLVEKERLESQIYNQVFTSEQRTKFDDMRQKQAAHIDEWLQHLASAPAQQ